MTPGQAADRALTIVWKAGGRLGAMVIMRKLSRSTLGEVAQSLEEAARLIRESLPPPGPVQ